MNNVELPFVAFEYITERLSQFYINNESALSFLASKEYRIPLQQYLCICYGVEITQENVRTRKIEFFHILGTVESNGGYWIQTYVLPEVIVPNESVRLEASGVFKIQDCNYLRQLIFRFQDKTSLFRSTLFFVPEEHKLYRIHCCLQFITLPVLSISNHLVIKTPEKFLYSETKKKQILKRLRDQIALSEASLAAHGALERSVFE
jgi:hypothetical protein